VNRVQLIQRALRIGFSIDELTATYRLRDRGGVPCQRVHRLVSERLEQLDRQIAELADLRKDLSALLAQWTDRLVATPPGHQARLLDMLAERPSLTPPTGSRRRFGRASSQHELSRP